MNDLISNPVQPDTNDSPFNVTDRIIAQQDENIGDITPHR